MRNHELPERHLRILKYIKEYQCHHGFPPGVREIMEGSGFVSTSTTQRALMRLTDRGYITRQPMISRSIVLQPPAYEVLEEADGE
jgi:SOS-response transcriptional repressor LexA